MKDPEIPGKDNSKTALTREHERQRRTIEPTYYRRAAEYPAS